MDIKLENMSYQDFRKWCKDRAYDGRWEMLEAMACLHIVREIDSIKVKGFFKRKATLRAREEAWKKYNFKSIK